MLRLLAGGRSNREIAAELQVSLRTVEHHITSIYTKLSIRNKSEATAYALRHGLASASP
ncbi:MAG: response regulator transcription factor [Dehalococcoidia bacterium]